MAKKQMDLNQTYENQLSLRSYPLCLHLYLKKNISQVKVKPQLLTKLIGTLFLIPPPFELAYGDGHLRNLKILIYIVLHFGVF